MVRKALERDHLSKDQRRWGEEAKNLAGRETSDCKYPAIRLAPQGRPRKSKETQEAEAD